MVEISKVSDVSILHLFGEISLLEMDWVSGMMEFAGKSADRKVWFHLAQADHSLFQAVKKNAARTGSLPADAANGFVGADQRIRDYSAVADSVLALMNQPMSPVRVVEAARKAEGVRSEKRFSAAGVFYH